MTTHRTHPEQAAVAGWAPLDDEQEITVIPVIDRRYAVEGGDPVFARLTYADALTVADRYGATLPTEADLRHLAEVGLQLFPFLGTPTAETALHHSKLHDADVWSQLRRAGWVSKGATQPVAGAGKHWITIDGMPADQSALMGWDKDGPGPGKQLWNPPMIAHNRFHHDDGTTTLLVRPRQRHEDIPPPSDTDPAPPPSGAVSALDGRTHGARCVAWMKDQMKAGVREVPDGSNRGPHIDDWLGACVRDGQPGIGNYLKSRGANWCAASACAADAETRRANDPPSPCKRRCSGFEIEADAKDAGAYRPVSAALDGSWDPRPGDFVHMRRGDPRKASDAWKRHVTRFVRWVSQKGPRSTWTLETIGGNEGNQFQLTTRPLKSVLCFIEMGRVEGVSAVVDLWSPPSQPPPPPDDLDGDGDNDLTREAWPHMDPSPWVADDWHRIPGALIQFAVYRGVIVMGEDGARRTKGEPVTLRKIDSMYHAIIEEAHEATGVERQLIAATIANESGKDPEAERYEAHLNDWSFGVMQTLTETAYALASRVGLTPPDKPVPRGGDPNKWRAFLFDPRNSILIGVAFLDYNDERFAMLGDPVLSYAAYNAGSPRVNLERPWGIHYFRHESDSGAVYDAMNTFVAWYGDAWAVYD